MSKYNKFIVALLGAVLTVVLQHFGDNQIVQTIAPIATALGVYQVPNR